jgi:hypothetical protein
MPRITIKDLDHLGRALQVLTRMDGTFQAIDRDKERYLLVTEAQYQALLEANAVNGQKGDSRGASSKKA